MSVVIDCDTCRGARPGLSRLRRDRPARPPTRGGLRRGGAAGAGGPGRVGAGPEAAGWSPLPRPGRRHGVRPAGVSVTRVTRWGRSAALACRATHTDTPRTVWRRTRHPLTWVAGACTSRPDRAGAGAASSPRSGRGGRGAGEPRSWGESPPVRRTRGPRPEA